LSPNVPDVELVTPVLQRLDVEAQGWGDGRDVLTTELLEDRRLPGIVKSPSSVQPRVARKQATK